MFQRLQITLLFLILAAASEARVVSTSPEVTEILFQLGKGGDIAATSDFSDFPDAATSLPRIGPLFMPSIERTLRFQPEWVLLDEANLSPQYERAVKAAGIPTVKLAFPSVASLFEESRRLLQTVYGQTKHEAIDQGSRCAASLPRIREGKFLILIWLSPPVLAGTHTFLSDLVSRTGGKNASPDSWRIPYPQVSEEWMLGQTIDELFFLTETPDASVTAQKLAQHWWPDRKVKTTGLSPRHFARVSFTPLYHLDELGLSREAGRECREPTR